MDFKARQVALPMLGAAALLFSMAGCSSFENSDDVAYCVDHDNKVVDQQKCDQDTATGHGSYFFLIGPYGTGLQPGHRLDPSVATYSRFRSNDTTSRENAGLPKTGSVTTGKSISGESGGFGKGGSGAKGGSSGEGGGFGGSHGGFGG